MIVALLSIKGITSSLTARPLFQFAPDASLPPLPGEAWLPTQASLALLVEDLVDKAGSNVIPAPTLAPEPPSITDAFEALRTASAHYDVTPGVGLESHFWTHGAALHSGAVAARLSATARSGRCAQGFLALYATEVQSCLLLAPNMAPLRARAAIGIPHAAGTIAGPYLALIACELLPDGRAEAVSGYAMPIYRARRFLPVRSELDRDVLRALEHLQIALDAHGIECQIKRTRDDTIGPVTRLAVTLLKPGTLPVDVQIVIDADRPDMPWASDVRSMDFTVTPMNWRNGSFVSWLKAVLI